jgi:hypothetical protein
MPSTFAIKTDSGEIVETQGSNHKMTRHEHGVHGPLVPCEAHEHFLHSTSFNIIYIMRTFVFLRGDSDGQIWSQASPLSASFIPRCDCRNTLTMHDDSIMDPQRNCDELQCKYCGFEPSGFCRHFTSPDYAGLATSQR